uniref:Uncharacterized protein n=1 Tax=Glycine max TaxID=3847 RepID=C6T415_SOYBN|nr:unknown [Glycine max]
MFEDPSFFSLTSRRKGWLSLKLALPDKPLFKTLPESTLEFGSLTTFLRILFHFFNPNPFVGVPLEFTPSALPTSTSPTVPF